MADCSKFTWIASKVKKKSTGTVVENAEFTIHPESASGDFTGTITISETGTTENINGNCAADHIWFVRPSGSPTYRYEGDLVKKANGKLKIKDGERIPLAVSLTDKRGAQSQSKDSENTAPEPPPPPDDWIAEQGGTLLNSTAQKP